jgi:hypothetical protein
MTETYLTTPSRTEYQFKRVLKEEKMVRYTRRNARRKNLCQEKGMCADELILLRVRNGLPQKGTLNLTLDTFVRHDLGNRFYRHPHCNNRL